MSLREWLLEVWIVLCYSTNTQLVLVVGLLVFLGFPALAEVIVRQIELPGLMAPLSDAIRDKLTHRFDKLAWIALIGFLALAIKSYRRDRRRLIGV